MSKSRSQFTYGLRAGTTIVQGNIPIGSNGAVGTVNIKGITSVVKNSTGDYTVNFDEKYLGLVGASSVVETGTAGADGYTVQLVDSSFLTGGYETVNSGDGYIGLQVLNTAGSLASPINCKVWVNFFLKTSEAG